MAKRKKEDIDFSEDPFKPYEISNRDLEAEMEFQDETLDAETHISLRDAEDDVDESISTYYDSDPKVVQQSLASGLFECLAPEMPENLTQKEQQGLRDVFNDFAKHFYRIAIEPNKKK